MQNLIPLLFLRPLRLFLPSEHVRRIRIVVLKATHLPFVFFIWVYERSRRLVLRKGHTVGPAQNQPVTTKALPASRLSLALDRDMPAPRPHRPLALRRPNETPIAPVHDDALIDRATADQLVNLVKKLADQVDGLTAMVAGQSKD